MDKLSSTEADVLTALYALKDDADLDNITHLLLEQKSLQEKSRLISVLNKLKSLKFLEIKKINLFDKFTVNDTIYPLNLKFPIYNPSDVIPTKADSVKRSKYEIRFFWPSNLYPDIYDLSGLIFNEKYYRPSSTTDKYIVTNNNCNIKIRDDELQIKICVKNINNISQFKKKKKISFPLKAKKINELLTQKIFSGSTVYETAQELLNALSGSPAISYVEVIKERCVRKMRDHTKIEISLINIQGHEWKTICIESRNFQKVLTLSLLVNQEDAEILSYDGFLQKYGRGA